MKRIGIIKSVADNEVTVLGFGEYAGNTLVEHEELGVELEVPTFKLDSGTVIQNTFGYYWAEEDSINDDILNYKNQGYVINSLDI